MPRRLLFAFLALGVFSLAGCYGDNAPKRTAEEEEREEVEAQKAVDNVIPEVQKGEKAIGGGA